MQAEQPGCRRHAIVVGDNDIELVGKRPGGSQVNGIEAATHASVQRRGIVEELATAHAPDFRSV